MDRLQYRHHCMTLLTLRIREGTVVSSVFLCMRRCLQNTVSSLLLFGFGTSYYRMTSLRPLHRGIKVLTGRHFDDSHVNLETFVLFLSARSTTCFYQPEKLGFVNCFQHFMHICHARHYSTLRNVHYWKRGEEREKRVLRDIVNRLTDGHVIVWCPRFESHMRPHFFLSFFIFSTKTSNFVSWFMVFMHSVLHFVVFCCLFDVRYRSQHSYTLTSPRSMCAAASL